jgi:hypothetical protein
MSTAEIKLELQRILDELPEDALPVILDRLKQFHGQTAEHIEKILTEDRELLERLAK